MNNTLYSQEFEEAVIGGLLTDPEACSEIFEILEKDDFYTDLGDIFNTIRHMWEENTAVSLITASEATGRPSSLLAQFTYKYTTPTATIACARKIKEKSILRKILKVCEDIQQIILDSTKPFSEILEEVERRVFNLGEYSDETIRHIKEYIEELSRKIKGEEITRGYSSSFKELDSLTGGLRKGELIIVASRPSVGKTALILNMMMKLAEENIPSVLFSLEMDALSIATRMISLSSGIPIFELRNGSKEVYQKALESFAYLSSCPIFINDSTLITPSKIKSLLRRHKEIRAVFVDYIQLIKMGDDNRVLELSNIVRDLKSIAREFDIPVVAVSQLSRAVEQRQNKRPQLSDLRESGGIEQTADIVLLLYRDDYYSKKEKTEDTVPVEIDIAKNRNGPLGVIKLMFEKKTNKFTNG
ncbi:replicative DNA helicase [bacterium]|nr:replicative DNA helicase [bacterium]